MVSLPPDHVSNPPTERPVKLHNPHAEVYVPDGASVEEALSRTTHLAVGAHPDDVELIGYPGVLECFGRSDRWFTGVVTTDGSGSPRGGAYAEYSDEQMRAIRRREQKKAAMVGEYAAVGFLDYASADLKEPSGAGVVGDLEALLALARPTVVYTHNLADRHDTHVATALRVIEACRRLGPGQRPERLLGGEVWRDLDWLGDSDKVILDVSRHENLGGALLGVFDSQMEGKRYDVAALGRRRAHATFHQSHDLEAATGLAFAMDLTPLVDDASLDPVAHVEVILGRFAADVRGRVAKLRS